MMRKTGYRFHSSHGCRWNLLRSPRIILNLPSYMFVAIFPRQAQYLPLISTEWTASPEVMVNELLGFILKALGRSHI